MIASINIRMLLAFVVLLLMAVPTYAAEPPDTTITVKSVGQTDASFALSSSDPASTFEYRVDASEWKATGSNLYFWSLATGSHVLEARAKDSAGQVDPTPASYSFSISGAPFRPTDEVYPPALTKFKANGKLLKFTASDYGSVEFTIEECGWRGLARSCLGFDAAKKNVKPGRFTLVLSSRFHRGKKYRIYARATSDTDQTETTKRMVTAR